MTGGLARPVTRRLRGHHHRRHLHRRGARRPRPQRCAMSPLSLSLLVARLQQVLLPALARELAAPLQPARRAAHLLRVARRRRGLVPPPALRAPLAQTHDEDDPLGSARRAKSSRARSPEPRRPRRRHPPPHRPHPHHADAHSEGQESARSPPEPQGAPRPRRRWRARELARSEHVGTLRVSMGVRLDAAGGSLARRRWIRRRRRCSRRPRRRVDHLPAAERRREGMRGGSGSRPEVGQSKAAAKAPSGSCSCRRSSSSCSRMYLRIFSSSKPTGLTQ